MPNQRNAIRAGVVMLFCLAAGIAIIIGIVGRDRFTERFQTHLVGFTLQDNLGGLRIGDDVRLGGLKVGIVESIHYIKKGSKGPNVPPEDAILCAISIPESDVLAVNAKVGVESTLTGVATLNISDLGDGPPLAPDAVLVGRPDSLTTLRAALADLGPKLNRDLDNANETLDVYKDAGHKVPADLHDLAGVFKTRVNDVSDSGVRALDSIHDWLGPSTVDFHTTVSNVRDLSATLKDKAPPLIASSQEVVDKLNDVMARAQSAVEDVKATISNAKGFTADLESVVARNQGRVDEISGTVKKAADNLEATTVEVRTSPWRLLYKPTVDEMANLNLYDAARQFADGANNLNDASIALRDSLKDPHADPTKVQKLYDDLLDQFNKFHEAEDALFKKVKE
jgi:ABC-type transporter Mla subunit MlaD